MTTYEICQVPTYKDVYGFNPTKPYLKVVKKTVKPIDTIKAILVNDLQLHERLHKTDLLKLSVDVDKMKKHNPSLTLDTIFANIKEYVGIETDEISYTTNFSVDSGSHHIVIPKYYMSSVNQKVYWKLFREKYGFGNEIDADIFDKDVWFRLPNQSKEGIKGTEHIIQKGDITDFVLKYIENAQEYALPEQIQAEKPKKKRVAEKKEEITDSEDTESETGMYANELKIIDSDIYYKYLNCIGSSMCGKGDHLKMINVLQALRNENCATKYVKYWIKKYCSPELKKYSYAVDKYDQDIFYTPLSVERRLSVNSLKRWAKENKALYGTYFKDDYEFQIKKIYNADTLITAYGDESEFMKLVYVLLEKTIILDGENIYLYYKDEWRTMKEKDCKILKDLIREIFEIYIKSALDIVNEHLKKNLNDDKIVDICKKAIKNICDLNVHIKKVNYITNICSLLKNKLATIKNTITFDLGSNNFYNIHFKNGVYDVKMKIFRTRLETDYVTQYLDYDYVEETEIDNTIKDEVYTHFEKIQPDQDQRRFTLSYLAYCLTGNTKKQVFKMNIGHTASNGKSTEMSIHDKCFELYSCKADRRVLQNDFDKRHKFLTDLVTKPIRLLYFEELPKGKKLDVTFIKDFVDGKKMDLEKLYGTKDDVKIQAKIMSVSNHDFNVDTDEGILRRGRVQYYTSKFVDECEVDIERHYYKKIDGFEDKFDCQYYKNAYFHLLLKYIDELYIPSKNKDDFKQKAEENDDVLNNIFDCFEITNDCNDTIQRHVFDEKLNLDKEKFIDKEKFKDYKGKLQSKGCEYKSQEKYSYDNPNPNAEKKTLRGTGIITHLKLKTI